MGENLAPEQLGLAGIRPFLEAAPPVRAEPEGIGAPLSRMRQRLVKAADIQNYCAAENDARRLQIRRAKHRVGKASQILVRRSPRA